MPKNFRRNKPGLGRALAKTARGIARMAAARSMARRTAPTTQRGGKPKRLLQEQERNRARRAIARAKMIGELERNPEAGELFKIFDEEMKSVFGAEYGRIIKSIPKQTLSEIKVMLWNGYFVPAEIKGLLFYIRESTPRQSDPRVFFRQKVMETVKQRRQEYEETGTIQTVFYSKAA